MVLIFLITICILMLGVSLLALRSNVRSSTNRFFFLFVFFFDVWLISNYLSNSLTDYNSVFIFNQLIFLSTTLSVTFLALFIKVYPNANVDLRKRWIYLMGIISVSISILSLTNFIVQDVVIKEGVSEIVFGDGTYLYVLFLLSLIIYSFYTLLIKFRTSSGIERLKIQYLLLGITLTFLGILVTNLILPLVFNYFDLSTFGTGFTLILVGLTGYSIIKHRLFGVKVLLGNLLSLAIVSTYVFSLFYIIVILENTYLGSPLSSEAFGVNVFVAFGFSVFFIVIYKFVFEVIRKTYIHSSYDPTEELDKFSQSISKTLNLEEVANDIEKSLVSTLKVEKVVVFIIKSQKLNIVNPNTHESTPLDFYDIDKFLSMYSYKVVLQVEVESLIFSGKALEIHRKIYNWNKENQFSVLIPLIDANSLTGLIALGKRGIPYDSVDINFLESISSSSNVSIGRANYFKNYENLIRSLEQQIADRTRQLKELAEEQKNIIDVMGHEIRTPLSVINTEVSLQQEVTLPNLDKWLNHKMSNDEIKMLFESIDLIGKATTQSIALVNDMLETARLDKKKFELNYSKFDLIAAAKMSLELMKKTADSKIYEFKFDSDVDELQIEADETRITQATQALISNAIKYGVNPENDKGDITLQITDEKDRVSISVIDKGIGIKKDDIEKLGQKFVRLEPETQNLQRPKGTGLGLFVVKSIAEFHGGTLEITSEGLGKGSQFKMTLPKSPSKVPTPQAQTPSTSPLQ